MIRHGIRVLLFLMLPLAALAGAASSATPTSAATVTVSTCDATSLGNAITNAVSGDTITFNCDGTLLTHTGAAYKYLIDKSLTIDGNGHNVTLDSENSSSMFYVGRADITLTLKGLT